MAIRLQRQSSIIKGSDNGTPTDFALLPNGKLDIEQTSLYTAQMHILKELIKLNRYLSMGFNFNIENEDIGV